MYNCVIDQPNSTSFQLDLGYKPDNQSIEIEAQRKNPRTVSPTLLPDIGRIDG
jgi:hypothetical protein